MISTKGRYAVRILLDVAQNGGESAVRIADIALRQGISAKYTEQITGMLVKAGLLRSFRGAGGGYALVRPPEDYTVLEILQKTEGDLAPVKCAADGSSCSRVGECMTYPLWSGLYKVINDYLEGITLKSLLDNAPSRINFYMI